MRWRMLRSDRRRQTPGAANQAAVSIFRDETEESVPFVRNSRCEINARPKRKQIPQAVELEWRPARSSQCFKESARRRIVVVNLAIAKIANPQFAFDQREPPRRIQISVRNEAAQEIAARIEHIDEALAWAGHVIFSLRVLLGVGHVNLAIEVSNPERCITSWQRRIGETVRVNWLKILVKSLNATEVKIGHVEKIMAVGHTESRTFVDGPFDALVCAVIDCDDGVCRIQGPDSNRRWNRLR